MFIIFYFFNVFFFFFYKIEILLYPNLSVYVCKTLSWKLKPRPLPPNTPQALTIAPRVCAAFTIAPSVCNGHSYLLWFPLT